jgi:hypothetical protein
MYIKDLKNRGGTMEPENASEPVQETEAIQPKNFFSRLGGVYLSPKNAFQEIGGSPRVLVPILVMIVIGFLLGFYLVRTIDVQAVVVSQLEKMVEQGRIPKEQMERSLPFAEKIASIQILVATSIGNVLFALIIAGFAKLFSALMGAQNRFKNLFSVTLYAMIAISILHSILMILVLHFKGSADMDINNIGSVVASNLGAVLGSFLGEDALPKFVLKLMEYVDVFAIWTIALLAIGYSAVSRKLKTAAAASWLIAAYAIIAIIGAAIRSR